jgi:16S rRNA (guanine527-N7)-methyltransferase
MKIVESSADTFSPEHFAPHLSRYLPGDIPNRERLIAVASQHLARISAANAFMNLTRITSPAEAAIKHVYDSVYPWQFFAGAERVLDAGTGAGFPGVPLSVLYPDTKWTLAESIGKKARFVDAVADELALANVTVVAERAESLAAILRPKVITARAVAPLAKLLDLFRKSLSEDVRLLLYKGPDVESEVTAMRHSRMEATVVARYELPENLGSRTVVEVHRKRK